MMKVVGYVRVSGRAQVDGDGPDRQKESIESFCKSHSLTYTDTAFEAAVSGTVEAMERPEFVNLMNFVEDCRETGEPVEAIVVERLDRLARDLMVSELLLAECRKRGLKVFSADQGALIDMASDGGDPTRVLIRQIMGALAQWEKSMLVKKLSSARNRIKAKTGRCEGKKPYGFYSAEKPVLKAMMDLSAVPGGTWRGVARQLNEAGLVTRAGGNWDSASVRRIILVARKERGSNMRT